MGRVFGGAMYFMILGILIWSGEFYQRALHGRIGHHWVLDSIYGEGVSM